MRRRVTCSMPNCALGRIFGIRKTSRFSCCSKISRSSMATSLTTAPTPPTRAAPTCLAAPLRRKTRAFGWSASGRATSFEGTPVTLFVGAELKNVSQAGIVGNDDPGIGVEAEFGDLDAVGQGLHRARIAAPRLGKRQRPGQLRVYGGLRPEAAPLRVRCGVLPGPLLWGGHGGRWGVHRGDIGCTGQKNDSVWIDASWTGRLGPVRALLQGNVILGTADGGTAGLPTAGVLAGREYDIFAGSVIGYVEVDLGVVRPFLLVVYGSPDGDPRDRQLRGFATCSPRATRRNGPPICWAISIRVRRRVGGGTIRVRRGARGADAERPRATPMPLARTSRQAAGGAIRCGLCGVLPYASRTSVIRAWGRAPTWGS